jgi:hypothetical protein
VAEAFGREWRSAWSDGGAKLAAERLGGFARMVGPPAAVVVIPARPYSSESGLSDGKANHRYCARTRGRADQ